MITHSRYDNFLNIVNNYPDYDFKNYDYHNLVTMINFFVKNENTAELKLLCDRKIILGKYDDGNILSKILSSLKNKVDEDYSYYTIPMVLASINNQYCISFLRENIVFFDEEYINYEYEMNSLIKFLILNKVEKLEDFIIEKMVLKNNLLNDIDIDENQFRLLLPFLKIKNYDLDSFFDNCLDFKNQKICEIFHCENIHINQLKLDSNNESKIHNLCKSSDNYDFIKFLHSNFKYLFDYKNIQGNTAIDVALSEYKNIFENPNKNLDFEKINEKINEIELLIGDLNELEYDTTKYMNYISNIKKILSF
jgi:hypothetical protein